MSNLSQGLKNLADKVGNAIEDLTSLEVTTYSGTFSLSYDTLKAQGIDSFKIKSLIQNNPASMQANLNLIAYSRFELDSDASNIVKSNLTTQEQALVDAHKAMVESAMTARKATFEMIEKMVGLDL